MIKLLKRVKGMGLPMVMIVLTLLVQAWAALALPGHIANIVDVGIQQGGIESAAPEYMRQNTFTELADMMSSEDTAVVMAAYRLIDSSSSEYAAYAEKSPNLGGDPIYVRQPSEDASLNERLSSIFGSAVLLNNVLYDTSGSYATYQPQLMEMIDPEIVAAYGSDYAGMLEAMGTEQSDKLIATAKSLFTNMSSGIIKQSGIAFVKNEYAEIGVDIEGNQFRYMWKEGGIMLGIAAINTIVSILTGYYQARLSSSIGNQLRKSIFAKVISFSNAEMERFSTASLITRSNNDIMHVSMMLNMGLRNLIYSPLMASGALVKAINIAPSLTWILCIAIVCVSCGVISLFRIVTPKFSIMQKFVDRINLVMREILNGLSVIRAFSTFKYEQERFDSANSDVRKINLFTSRTMGLMMPMMSLIMNGTTLCVVWFGAKVVNLGGMQVGDITAYMSYSMEVIMSFMMLSNMTIQLPRAVVSANRINAVLDSTTVINDPEVPKAFVPEKLGEVEFKNVSFAYPDAESNVISDISFTAKAGQTTAIIGGTGSGKSTIVTLLPRFYDVTEGEILVNGVNVKDMTQHELRSQIGYIPQKGLLFSGTIESNIRFGKPDMSDDDVLYAADIAQADSFIREKPYGYYDVIAQGGANVSGGQKQRLSIARAIAPKPRIYAFDDSFSALDFKTDAALRKALNEKLHGATILIVAQRISTIMNAENIIVLEEGKIVGQGTHAELLKNCDVYKEIAYSQLSEEELKNA